MRNKKKFIAIAAILLMITAGMILLFIESPLNAQKQGDNLSKNKPDVKIKVQKKTDKDGNITSYDSTYISTWSGGNANGINVDSIINSMNQQFHSFSFGNQFGSDSLNNFFGNDFFGNDSVLFGNNFNHDFFGHFNSNAMKEMEEMIKQHRSMMEHFFNNRHNYLVPSDSLPKEEQKAVPQQNSYNGGVQL